MDPAIRYARTSDGVSIAYAVLGEGPTLISASNIWGDLHLYRNIKVMRLMNDAIADLGLRYVIYDLRGMGGSDTSTDYGLDARMRDVNAVADAVGAQQFALSCLASGAPTGIAYAATFPDRVSRLIVINSLISGKDWYRVVPAMRVTTQLATIAAEDWEMYTLAMANAVFKFGDSEVAGEFARAYQSSCSPSEFLAFLKATEGIDVRDQFAQVRCPTLALHVTPMLSGTLPFVREVAAGIPDAQFAEVPMGPDLGTAIGEFLGVRAPSTHASADSPFRAVLFTDLVGHTEMMRRLGDAKGRAVLREHEALIRDVLKQHGGSEVKTMGDGFMASFPSVTRGVECAIALQEAFGERNATSAEPLSVRVGLNAGEPIEDDGDLFGETVILAARIAGTAGAGEILCSLAVRELCAGKGFTFADRGEQAMRGFEEPVRVFAVHRPG